MPGPSKKPAALKSLAGTTQPCRAAPAAVDLPVVTKVPGAPVWLPAGPARAEWKRLATMLTANKLLTEGGLSALAVLCGLYGKIVAMFEADETPTASLVAQYRTMVNDFGLTPVAQTRVKAGETAKPGNKFRNNGKRGS